MRATDLVLEYIKDHPWIDEKELGEYFLKISDDCPFTLNTLCSSVTKLYCDNELGSFYDAAIGRYRYASLLSPGARRLSKYGRKAFKDEPLNPHIFDYLGFYVKPVIKV